MGWKTVAFRGRSRKPGVREPPPSVAPPRTFADVGGRRPEVIDMDEVRGSSPLPPTTLAVPRLAALARDARLIRDAGRRPRASPFGGRVERFKSCTAHQGGKVPCS